MEYRILEDHNVCKFVFNKQDMVAESVLYKYESYKTSLFKQHNARTYSKNKHPLNTEIYPYNVV